MAFDFHAVLWALAGGALIGLAASILWFGAGRIAGVTGILGGALRGQDAARGVRIAFLLGLVLAGVFLSRTPFEPSKSTEPLAVVVFAGLLVGFGARVGGGCTSGHGVCGLSRLSLRSLAATLTFMASGALTVFLVQHWLPSLGGVR